MFEYLKVKIISLADEARTIRREEKKAKADGETELLIGLMDHRKGPVRYEARSSLLAYGYLRGIPYRVMERKCREEPDWKRVIGLAKKFGSGWDEDRDVNFKNWREKPWEERRGRDEKEAALGVERGPREAEGVLLSSGADAA